MDKFDEEEYLKSLQKRFGDYCANRQPKVESILASHPIYQKIGKQIDKGIQKYGTPINPEHYSVMGWLQHMQEEHIDALTYANALEERLSKAESILSEIMSYSHSIQIDDLLELLYETLFKG